MQGDELDQICNHSLLSPQEERLLGQRSLKGDREARSLLVAHNLRLVASIAKGFVTNHNTLGDCIGVGTIGLIKAAERYDPDKGTRFSTYATWWIKEALLKANWEQESPLVRVPNWIGGLDKKEREGQDLTEKEKVFLQKADTARRYHADIFSLGDDLTPEAVEEEPPQFPAEYARLLEKALSRLSRRD